MCKSLGCEFVQTAVCKHYTHAQLSQHLLGCLTCWTLVYGLVQARQDAVEDGLGVGQRHAVDGDHSRGQATLGAVCHQAVALPCQLVHHQGLSCNTAKTL